MIHSTPFRRRLNAAAPWVALAIGIGLVALACLAGCTMHFHLHYKDQNAPLPPPTTQPATEQPIDILFGETP